MRPQREMPAKDVEWLKERLRTVKTAAEYRHTYVLYLRGVHGYTYKEIASLSEYSVQRVAAIIGRYFKYGLGIMKELGNKRSRKWGHMTLEEEQAFIGGYLEKAKNGEVIEVSAIKKEYDNRIGKQTSPSVIYSILHRHGWRKIVPRPAHPKKDAAKAEAFKKTLAN